MINFCLMGADGNCNDGLDYPLRSCFFKNYPPEYKAETSTRLSQLYWVIQLMAGIISAPAIPKITPKALKSFNPIYLFM